MWFPTVDRLREIGDVLHDICHGLLEPDEADVRRAGEPLRRATLSQSLYPELSIRSFSKLDQTDHIGRWDGAESECVGPKPWSTGLG